MLTKEQVEEIWNKCIGKCNCGLVCEFHVSEAIALTEQKVLETYQIDLKEGQIRMYTDGARERERARILKKLDEEMSMMASPDGSIKANWNWWKGVRRKVIE